MKKWLGYNLYKKLWSLIGGRPWTYIIRDFYHKAELFIIVGFFMFGYFIRPYLSVGTFWTYIGVLSGGYILGHLFWGRKWIRGQKGN